MYKLKECPTAGVISGILNVVNVVGHHFVMERLKECRTAHVIQYSAGLLYEYNVMFTE